MVTNHPPRFRSRASNTLREDNLPTRFAFKLNMFANYPTTHTIALCTALRGYAVAQLIHPRRSYSRHESWIVSSVLRYVKPRMFRDLLLLKLKSIHCPFCSMVDNLSGRRSGLGSSLERAASTPPRGRSALPSPHANHD